MLFYNQIQLFMRVIKKLLTIMSNPSSDCKSTGYVSHKWEHKQKTQLIIFFLQNFILQKHFLSPIHIFCNDSGMSQWFYLCFAWRFSELYKLVKEVNLMLNVYKVWSFCIISQLQEIFCYKYFFHKECRWSAMLNIYDARLHHTFC